MSVVFVKSEGYKRFLREKYNSNSASSSWYIYIFQHSNNIFFGLNFKNFYRIFAKKIL